MWLEHRYALADKKPYQEFTHISSSYEAILNSLHSLTSCIGLSV
jgi:hypothetical protein